MKIEEQSLKYLAGELFDSGFSFPIYNGLDRKAIVESRFDLIKKICTGSSVLHVGCADHIGLIEAKRSNGTWIHGYLTKVSSKCIGVDINREAIDYLQNSLGITNVVYADITKETPVSLLVVPPWDKVFLGEIIEHIDDPVSFLRSLKNGLGAYAKELIVTAPNAFRWQNFKKVWKGVECINSDHRFWFSPYTLAKIALNAGLRPRSFRFVTAYKVLKPTGIRSYFEYCLLLRFPGFRDTIVLRADF